MVKIAANANAVSIDYSEFSEDNQARLVLAIGILDSGYSKTFSLQQIHLLNGKMLGAGRHPTGPE